MGAGKSSVGRRLSGQTGLALLDTDEMVASKFGISIPEIFSEHGERKFREAETEALRSVKGTQQTIIVTGGGILLSEQNVEILKRLGVLVWLDGEEQTLFARASRKRNRPLLQTKNPREAFSQIMGARRPLYANIAHIRIDTSMLTDQEVVVAILTKLGRANQQPGLPVQAMA